MATVTRVPDLSNITINGVPLIKVIRDETVKEFQTTHAKTVSEMNFVKQLHTVSKFRNISGARSSRGRVIYSRPANA